MAVVAIRDAHVLYPATLRDDLLHTDIRIRQKIKNDRNSLLKFMVTLF